MSAIKVLASEFKNIIGERLKMIVVEEEEEKTSLNNCCQW